MTENEAIELGLRLHSRHIVPGDNVERDETTITQNIADIYRAGYELVPRFQPRLSMGEIQRMKEEGVVY